MSYTEEQLWTLLEQAYRMPYGPGQIALIEQIITHADAAHLTPLGFAARMQATTSYVYGGERARSFATFAWCLAEFDRDPATYERYYRTLLWHFKYMVSALTRFPEVPLARTYDVLDDMQRRWQETGHSLHAVYAYRHHVAAHIGDVDAAEEYYTQWCAAPRDDLSDCVGCDPTSKAWWLSQRGRYEEAVALGDSVLSGALTCSEQPQSMLAMLMVPYLKTGRLAQARDAHRRAYRLHRPHLADLESIADHVEFCARTGNEARAIEIVERHLGWLDRAPSPWAAMLFAAASALALRRAQQRHGEELILQRPGYGDREASPVSATALAEQLTAQATELAEQFDRRNGTDRVGTLVRQTLTGEPWIDHLPLSPTASQRRGASGSAATASTVEELFAKTTPATPAASPPPEPTQPQPRQPGPTSPASAPPAVGHPEAAVVPTSGPEELLSLIETHLHGEQDAQLRAAVAAFTARYGEHELTPHQRARFADAQASVLADQERIDEAAARWRQAADEYAAAGDVESGHRARARAAAALCWTDDPSPADDASEADSTSPADDASEALAVLTEETEWLLAHGSLAQRVWDATRLAIAHHNAQRPEPALAILDRVTGDLAAAPLRHRARHALVRLSTLAQLGHADEILRTGDAAIELAQAAGLTQEQVRGHMALAAARQHVGDLAAAADHLAAAIALTPDEAMRTGLRRARAALLARTERAGEAVDDLVDQVAEATARGRADEAADARHSLAIAYLNTDLLLDAAEVAEEELAHRLRAATTTVDDRLETRELLAVIYQRLGHPVDAVEQLDAMAEELGQAGDRAGVGQCAQRAAEILDGANREADAAARFLTAAVICAELGLVLPELYNRRRHAMSLRWAGQIEAAVEALNIVDELAARADESAGDVTGPDTNGPEVNGPDTNDPPANSAEVNGTDANSPDANGADAALRWERVRLDYDAARILWAAGRPADAAQRAERAAQASLSLDSPGSAAESWLMQARILLDDQRPAQAQAAIQQALAVLPADADRDPYDQVLQAAQAAQRSE